MPRKRILVLGGSGFVGRHLVGRLSGEGRRVVVPTRRRARARHLILLPTVEVIEADIHDPAMLATLVADADAVINLVGILNEGGGETFARAHVELAAKVIAACQSAGVRRYLHMSALNADPSGPSAYLRTKGEAAALVLQSGLDWTIFEPSVIFGREDRFLNLFAALSRTLPVIALGGADAKFQPVHVGDVAACFAKAIDDDATIGQRYCLCGPKVYTLRELVRYAADLAGSPRPIVPLGPGLARLQAFVLEHLPGRLMSRDNLASMQRDSVCSAPFPPDFGIVPTALEAEAPQYLSALAAHSRYDDFRAHGGR